MRQFPRVLGETYAPPAIREGRMGKEADDGTRPFPFRFDS
jgi:hypothetical protein